MTAVDLSTLEEKLTELTQIKVYNNSVSDGVQYILKSLPSPEKETDVKMKIRVLQLRSKARLLLPSVSKEAEQDIQSILKLKQDSCDAWIDLAECYLRRNAFKDCAYALQNALRVEKDNTKALCKYSQLQRNRCSETGLTLAQKEDFIKESVEKGHAAVNSNITSGEAWNSLSLALLSQLTNGKMSYGGLRKVHAAMQKAYDFDPADPDIVFNKGAIESLMGHFAQAATSFGLALSLDRYRLSGAKRLCEANASIVNKGIQRIKSLNSIGKAEFRKFCDIAKANQNSAQNNGTMCLVVVDVLTDQSMQPLCLLTVSQASEFSFTLLYNIKASVFNIGQSISFPSSTPTAIINHRIAKIDGVSVAQVETQMTHYYADPGSFKLNGKSLPTSAAVPVQFSSRLFA